MLERIGFPRRAHVESPCGNVDLVVYADQRSLWAVLVNLAGEQTGGPMARPWARTAGPVPPTDVRLHLATEGREARRVLSAGEELPSAAEHGSLVAPIALDDEWRVVRVDWQ